MTKMSFIGNYERDKDMLDLEHIDMCGSFKSTTNMMKDISFCKTMFIWLNMSLKPWGVQGVTKWNEESTGQKDKILKG